MHAIEAHDLRKTYPGGVEAVRGIDFEVAEGEVFGLLGPNGAGKSTTVGMLTTTIVPTAGTARLAGHDVAKSPLLGQERVERRLPGGGRRPRPHRPRQPRAPHEALGRTAAKGQAPDRGARRSARAERARSTDAVHTYSGGERRRLEIARALCSEPQVLFLDEPTVGLDPRIRHELLDVIAGLRARDELTILVTTHYLDEAQRLCDRVAIIHEGSLVALDSSAGAARAARPGDPRVPRRRQRRSARSEACATGESQADDAFAIGARITVPLHTHAATEALAAIESEHLRASEIATRAPNLDDVYLQLTGGAPSATPRERAEPRTHGTKE